MSRVWLVVKYVVASALLLFASLMALGWYLKHSKDEARRNSPFIQKLEQAEREKGDVLKLLFDGMKTADDDEAKLVVEWLLPRQLRGEHPYLYVMGFYYGKQNDNRQKVRALEYLARAALVYRVDALKCGDPTANQAVSIFESAVGMKTVRDSLQAKPDIRQKVILDALAFEEKHKDRPRPDWVCRHGVKPGSPAPAPDLAAAQREKIRAQFQTSY